MVLAVFPYFNFVFSESVLIGKRGSSTKKKDRRWYSREKSNIEERRKKIPNKLEDDWIRIRMKLENGIENIYVGKLRKIN